MPFYYVNGSTEFDIEELPLDRWIEIQKVTGKEWHQCLNRTLFGNLLVAKAVLEACAAETSTTLPSPMKIKDVLQLLSHRQAENTPSQYNEGVPDPKAKGSEPETT